MNSKCLNLTFNLPEKKILNFTELKNIINLPSLENLLNNNIHIIFNYYKEPG